MIVSISQLADTSQAKGQDISMMLHLTDDSSCAQVIHLQQVIRTRATELKQVRIQVYLCCLLAESIYIKIQKFSTIWIQIICPKTIGYTK